MAKHRWELATGLALTLLAVSTHAGRLALTQRLEWDGFDFLVQRFSRVPASDRIVHIDIDDDALNRVGSWPWPRDLQAEMIRDLKELGAARIMIDIVWSEPRPRELRVPGLDRFTDVEGPVAQLGEISEGNLVYPDDELAGAIADAGHVCLSMYYEAGGARPSASRLEEQLADLLRRQFEQDADALEKAVGRGRGAVEAVLPGAKRRVAEERVTAFLAEHPQADYATVHRAILSTPANRLTADREDVLAAFHRAKSLQVLRDRCPPVPAALRGRLPKADHVVPPLYQIGIAARRMGFVTFHPDADGRTRHVPLLLDWDGRLLEHLAFVTVRESLGIRTEELTFDHQGRLVIAGRDGRPEYRVQLNEQGEMLINWHVAARGWQECFDHKPAALLLRLSDCRRRMRENDQARQWKIGRAISLIKDDAGFSLYRAQVNRMLELERSVGRARLLGQDDSDASRKDAAEARQLRSMVEQDQNDTLTLIREEWSRLQAESDPDKPDIAADYKRFKEAHELIAADVAELDQAIVQLTLEHKRLADQMRPLFEGKTCVVGYTATAVADMVTTPPYPRVPGVLVHSNVLNSFLVGRFRTWSNTSTQAGIIALLGLVATLASITRGPWTTFLLLVSIAVGAALLSAFGLFARMDHWLALVTAILLMFVNWAFIVMVRYLTSEREKRRFSRAVAQYVSPAMARRIADTTAKLDLAPVQGEVSCFFSDLAGFTPLSERLGPEGTRTLLNPYLESMSEVLHHHRALINKFMGDGVFAFFNPPILPCPDHAVAVCEAALDSLRALQELKASHVNHPLGREFERLFVRIGISSGPVFVGDYGSENKLDYTCMGDTVNLAARLESANKYFGTAIMVAGSTHDIAGDRFLYRRLGAIQVKGKSEALAVYELLGRPGEVNAELVEVAGQYERAVTAFSRRDWQQADAVLQQCLRIRPGDLAVERYRETIRRYLSAPPPPEWHGEIELTEK
ncbi:MAG TPA: CHASE2 domain-containing protein [Phycisphaerae bacterium]|nr:CHASE2 domain-containing protein [Phycisphaerae bacterium]HRY66779.1 CHASE2 domain-containing protein [Phycisphaerae bacterium]HSA28419.1 CHASE2 domain-containing protein [Phycisphaerae bacterium]